MRSWIQRLAPVVCCALLAFSLMARGDDDDDKAADGPGKGADAATQPSLNAEQQRAVGIVVAHPVAAKTPQRIEALGLVLDGTTLISDMGEAAAAAAAEQSAAAELKRLHGLYEGGAGASVKMLEAAQADEARAAAQAQVAAARFALHWGPLAAMPAAARQKAADASAGGRSLLVRADILGRHTVGALPANALLDVDGIQVPGRVLGVLRQSTELQSAGLLIEVPNPPAGLGAGARVPLALLMTEQAGLLLPREAVLYDENGAYVYKQLTKKTAAENARYAPVRVTLLVSYGEGWLVGGIDDDDSIVVHGAGVLWSLLGMGGHAVDDDDD